MTNPTQNLEQLKSKHRALNDRLVRAQATTESAASELKQLEQEATELYGTSDTEKLTQILLQWESENAKALEDYMRMLDSVELELNSIQQILNS